MAPGSAFAQAILGNHDHLDLAQAEREVVDATLALQRRCPELRMLVLECTNMPPYREAMVRATGLEVLSLLDSPVWRAALARPVPGRPSMTGGSG